MIIRYATVHDLDGILKIMNDAILHTTAIYDYNIRSEEYIKTWFQKKMSDTMPVLVAELEGHVAGYASYGIFRPFEGFRFCLEHSVYVAAPYRGRKLGGALLGAIIHEARAQGYKTMIGAIDADNKASLQLHSRFGFQQNGLLPSAGYKFDRWLDLVFMQLML